MQITKPMLAETCEDLDTLQFPLGCTPKVDFIRCLKPADAALSRSFKPIRNKFAREWIEANIPAGCDMELGVKGRSFSEAVGDLAREDGQPDFVCYVFDYVNPNQILCEGYEARMMALADLKLPARCVKLLPVICHNVAELLAYESKCLAEGYEGVMMRTLNSPYKCGRSSVKEGFLLKLKRFADSEAVILDTVEKMQNTNEKTKDAFGNSQRSTAQAGKVGLGVLGALKVRDIKTGCEFSVGFNHLKSDKTGAELWRNRASLVGQVIKYKHQPSGASEAPRFPTMLSFRPAWDMGN